MYLCDRGRRQGLFTEFSEDFHDRFAIGTFDNVTCRYTGKRVDAVLQAGELIGNVLRQQITPG